MKFSALDTYGVVDGSSWLNVQLHSFNKNPASAGFFAFVSSSVSSTILPCRGYVARRFVIRILGSLWTFSCPPANLMTIFKFPDREPHG